MHHAPPPGTRFPSFERPVVIVGGGLSGLAAAIELTLQNIPVVVLEQKPRLGGRAYSFVDETTGDVIDNGQHVLIAGYDHTMRFLERIGTRDLLSMQKQPLLFLHHPKRGLCQFRLPALVPPFHLMAGILLTNLFGFREKFRLLRAGMTLQKRNSQEDDRTIEQWLDAIGQTEELKVSFWEPLAISIMNEHITRASAKVFVESLRHAFLAAWKNAALAIPRVGLSELYVDPAMRLLTSSGAEVRLNTNVASLDVSAGNVDGVRLRDGETVSGSAVILAVPHYEAADFLEGATRDEALSSMNAVPNTPIVSVHLWFEEDFMRYEFVGLIGRRVQWVFNKTHFMRGGKAGSHVSCVISGADDFVALGNDELIRIAVEDLRTLHARVAEPFHAVVIREKRATFSCTPAAERVRPSHLTTLSNLFLAGDWTNTGLPATIEGAIISGERCALLALDYLRKLRVG